MTPDKLAAAFQIAWVQYFGHPRMVRLDAHGTHTSTGLETWAEQNEFALEVVTDKNHGGNGLCEVVIRWCKTSLEKILIEFPKLDPKVAAANAAAAHNSLSAWVDGRSPDVRVFGKERRIPGIGTKPLDPEMLTGATRTIGDGELGERDKVRKFARKTYLESVCNKRIQTALRKRGRTQPVVSKEHVGKKCRYYRGLETSLSKGERGWYDAEVIGVFQTGYVLKTTNGRVLKREARYVNIL